MISSLNKHINIAVRVVTFYHMGICYRMMYNVEKAVTALSSMKSHPNLSSNIWSMHYL